MSQASDIGKDLGLLDSPPTMAHWPDLLPLWRFKIPLLLIHYGLGPSKKLQPNYVAMAYLSQLWPGIPLAVAVAYLYQLRSAQPGTPGPSSCTQGNISENLAEMHTMISSLLTTHSVIQKLENLEAPAAGIPSTTVVTPELLASHPGFQGIQLDTVLLEASLPTDKLLRIKVDLHEFKRIRACSR
ncbi:Hypothetical predicted protein, partial [Pelobates cultripes]